MFGHTNIFYSVLFGFLVLLVSQAYAHEYWLDPVDTSITSGSDAIVDIRNGEHFVGAAFPYDARKYQSITVISPDGQEPYEGRLGDYPAIHPELSGNGLHSINVETVPKILIYDSWQRFSSFLDYHGFKDIAQRHADRQLPTDKIIERYSRSAKTLIQVNKTGHVEDGISSTEKTNPRSFDPIGADMELILLENPYSVTDSLQLKLLFDGKPLAGRQIEMFWKGTQLLRFTTRSDEQGMASFKLLGGGDYLINAVQLVEPEKKDVHWLSYWASYSFEL